VAQKQYPHFSTGFKGEGGKMSRVGVVLSTAHLAVYREGERWRAVESSS